RSPTRIGCPSRRPTAPRPSPRCCGASNPWASNSPTSVCDVLRSTTSSSASPGTPHPLPTAATRRTVAPRTVAPRTPGRPGYPTRSGRSLRRQVSGRDGPYRRDGPRDGDPHGLVHRLLVHPSRTPGRRPPPDHAVGGGAVVGADAPVVAHDGAVRRAGPRSPGTVRLRSRFLSAAQIRHAVAGHRLRAVPDAHHRAAVDGLHRHLGGAAGSAGGHDRRDL